jgi:hypothetical protein
LAELVSAQSSLNMPTPATAASHDVEHAYQHLDEAIRQIAKLMNGTAWEPEEPKEEPNEMVLDVDELVRELGVDPHHIVNKKPMQLLGKDIEERVVPTFLGQPKTDMVRASMTNMVRTMINQMDHQGLWFR